jgi:hypothetical protein
MPCDEICLEPFGLHIWGNCKTKFFFPVLDLDQSALAWGKTSVLCWVGSSLLVNLENKKQHML